MEQKINPRTGRFNLTPSKIKVNTVNLSGDYIGVDRQDVAFNHKQKSITQVSYNRAIQAGATDTACALLCTNLSNLPETGELVLIIDNNATKITADEVEEGEEQTYTTTGVQLNVSLPTSFTGYTIVNMANISTIPVAYEKSLEVHFLIVNNTIRITLIRQ